MIGMLTNLFTFSALTAGGFAYHELGMRAEPLRIMAPLAPERTAFHKHRCADTRTVKNGKFLDIKYNAGFLIHFLHQQFCAADNVILITLIQLDEITTPAPHAHDQIAVIFGMGLGV